MMFRHTMSTDTPRMSSVLWDMLDVGWTCWDVHEPNGHPRDSQHMWCDGLALLLQARRGRRRRRQAEW